MVIGNNMFGSQGMMPSFGGGASALPPSTPASGSSGTNGITPSQPDSFNNSSKNSLSSGGQQGGGSDPQQMMQMLQSLMGMMMSILSSLMQQQGGGAGGNSDPSGGAQGAGPGGSGSHAGQKMVRSPAGGSLPADGSSPADVSKPSTGSVNTPSSGKTGPITDEEINKATHGDKELSATLKKASQDPKGAQVLRDALNKGTTYRQSKLSDPTVGLTTESSDKPPDVQIDPSVKNSVDTITHESAHAAYPDMPHNEVYNIGHQVAKDLGQPTV
jgi:hypothetical protein